MPASHVLLVCYCSLLSSLILPPPIFPYSFSPTSPLPFIPSLCTLLHSSFFCPIIYTPPTLLVRSPRLLKVKPEERLTIEGVLAHPWLNCTEALDNVLPSAQMMMDKVSGKLKVMLLFLNEFDLQRPLLKVGQLTYYNMQYVGLLFFLLFLVPVLLPLQAVVAGIQQAHAEQLANMRIQDLNVSLKPLNSVNNPILRKRKLLGYDCFY